MPQSDFNITHFVRGMAWHDIGKPFALPTPRHGPLGYWLLCLAGYPSEALVALAHGYNHPKKGVDPLRRYLAGPGHAPLPAVLLLGNPLDRLSASIYSFQSKGQQTSCHAMQNPFSRLPVRNVPGWEGPFAIHDLDQFEGGLWEDLRLNKLDNWSGPWQEVFTPAAKQQVEGGQQPLLPPQPLPASEAERQALINRLLSYLETYPERTYPAVNDTSLAQHGRLSGILAFVVYRNIERRHQDWLTATLTLEDGTLQPPPSFPGADNAVRRNLTASLVRISLAGHQARYQGAVRVDDLYGALELTNLTQAAFKLALAARLGAPALADFLTISESQFDLIYLLPPLPDGEPLETAIHNAYQAALDQVVQQITGRLEREFYNIAVLKDELKRQLNYLGYGVRAIAVDFPREGRFNSGAAAYGRQLLDAYLESQGYAVVSQAHLRAQAEAQSASGDLPADDTCQVCGNHPLLKPPDEVKSERARAQWRQKRDYAAHIFRGEREQICLSCLARRTLAYGSLAKKMDEIIHPLLERVEAEPGLWRSMAPANAPPPPPLLASAVRLRGDDDMVDMEALYVRYRRTGGRVDHADLDVFPTTSYAADANGNVMLLAIQPTQALFAPYDYGAAIEDLGQSITTPVLETELWQDTFVTFYRQVQAKREGEALASPIRQVQPHLARVMERIQWVKQFYQTFWTEMQRARLRVLPLTLDYPTLRFLLPADTLNTALQYLDRVMTETLFSASYGETLADREQTQAMLALLLPNLLHGVAILFKHKYPLYLALEAERDLFRQLGESDPAERPAGLERPSNADWYGLRLAFSDLRGTLSQVGPKLAEVTYADLGQVLDLADPKTLDRRTVAGRANIVNNMPLGNEDTRQMLTRLADDLTTIRADKLGKGEAAEALLAAGAKKFAPVLFIKTAIRE